MGRKQTERLGPRGGRYKSRYRWRERRIERERKGGRERRVIEGGINVTKELKERGSVVQYIFYTPVIFSHSVLNIMSQRGSKLIAPNVVGSRTQN